MVSSWAFSLNRSGFESSPLHLFLTSESLSSSLCPAGRELATQSLHGESQVFVVILLKFGLVTRHLLAVLTAQAQSLEATWWEGKASFHRLSCDIYTYAVVCVHLDVNAHNKTDCILTHNG